MPGPNRQVTGLRTGHSLEIVSPVVKIGRTRVGIREPGLEIYGVHQVRTITLPSRLDPRVKRSRDYR
jgi:hypothetical protein